MSATSTPASSSHNETDEKQASAEVFRKLNTEKLIEFLRGEEDLQTILKSSVMRSLDAQII